MPSSICLIPARLGSKRLAKKNLRMIGGDTLLGRAVKKALSSQVFDEVWVSSESSLLGEIAVENGAKFHQRPDYLGSDSATSEDFVADFLSQVDCDYIFQLHSIAPLISVEEIRQFRTSFLESGLDCYFSTKASTLEVVYQGVPVNFSFGEKTNSQELIPIEEITWSITAWKSPVFMRAHLAGGCGTYAGNQGFFRLSAYAAMVIKTEEDLTLASAIDAYLESRNVP